MTFWQVLACSFCGTVGAFTALFVWCACVLAGRADEALEDARGDG